MPPTTRSQTVHHRVQTVHHRAQTVRYRAQTVRHRAKTVRHRAQAIKKRAVGATASITPDEICHISMLYPVPEVFTMFLTSCTATELFQLRQVCQHWKAMIDQSSPVQESLFLRPRRVTNVLELKPDHGPETTTVQGYLVTGKVARPSQLVDGEKYSVPAEWNEVICVPSRFGHGMEMDRRVTMGEWIQLKDDLVQMWIEEAVAIEWDKYNKTKNKEAPDVSTLPESDPPGPGRHQHMLGGGSGKTLHKTQLDMFLTQPPVKSVYVADFLAGHQRVTNPSGLRLRDVLTALESGMGMKRAFFDCWNLMAAERKGLGMNLNGAFDAGLEGMVFMGADDWKEVDRRAGNQ